MRLSWFTPLPHRESDLELPASLPQYLRHLLPTLSRRVELTIFTKQHHWEPWIDDVAPVRPITASDKFWGHVHQADLAVYHLADRPRAFAELFDLSRTQAGLAVLHEPSIHSLVAFTWADFRRKPETYLEILRRYEGKEGEEEGRRWLAQGIDQDYHPQSPLLGYLFELALGAVSHCPRGLPEQHMADLPTAYLPLPFVADPQPPQRPATNAPRSLVLLADPDRSLFPFFESVALHPIQPNLQLSVLIPEIHRNDVEAALQELGLASQTRLFYDQEHPDFQPELATASLVVDLRPAPEQELFYRLFPLWQSGTPTSAMLPPEHAYCRQGLLLGMRGDRARDDFARHLTLLHGSPQTLYDMGDRAQRHLPTHHPDRYVDALLSVAADAVRQHTPAACRRFAHRLSTHLDWLPEASRPAIYDQAAAFLQELSNQRPPLGLNRSLSVTTIDNASEQVELLKELRDALEREKQARLRADARIAELERRSAMRAGAPAMAMDPYYLAFENRFRGSTEQIKKRLEVYGPQLIETAARFPEALCIDLGCGRGEWLQLLEAQGLKAQGIDSNESMVEACREQGLDVRLGDGPELLQACSDESVALLTGFHIIEHLPSFEALVSPGPRGPARAPPRWSGDFRVSESGESYGRSVLVLSRPHPPKTFAPGKRSPALGDLGLRGRPGPASGARQSL